MKYGGRAQTQFGLAHFREMGYCCSSFSIERQGCGIFIANCQGFLGICPLLFEILTEKLVGIIPDLGIVDILRASAPGQTMFGSLG